MQYAVCSISISMISVCKYDTYPARARVPYIFIFFSSHFLSLLFFFLDPSSYFFVFTDCRVLFYFFISPTFFAVPYAGTVPFIPYGGSISFLAFCFLGYFGGHMTHYTLCEF